MKNFLFLIVTIISVKLSMAQNTTWNSDVACILYTHCTNCHNSAGVGATDFTTYTNAKNHAFGIKSATQAKRMPPYPPDVTYQKYTHQRLLSTNEIDLIANWVDNNTPLGAGTLPTPPTYSAAGVMVMPDLILSMPTYTVNTISGDIYRNFVIPAGIAANKFIKEIEVIPGNRNIVHHALVFQDISNTPAALDAADPGPGYTSAGTGSNQSKLVFGWVPGQSVQTYPTGFGMKLDANTNILLQIHYPSGVVNEIDSTKVRIKFIAGTVRNIISAPILNHDISLTNGPLFIPANTTKTFHQEEIISVNATVFSASPHMHKIGRNIKSFAVTSIGDTIPFINIPKWDFNWQGTYNFQKPIKVPAGSKLYATAFYDNTTNNPFNPFNPPQNISLGESTTDEMMLVYFNYTNYQAGDENIIVDTASHDTHFNNCSTNPLQLAAAKFEAEISISPNPSVKEFIVNLPSIACQVQIINLQGQILYTNSNANKKLLFNNFEPGNYRLVVQNKSTGVICSKALLVY